MKAPKKKPATKRKIETEPDAWERFEKAIHKIAPPKKPKAKESPSVVDREK